MNAPPVIGKHVEHAQDEHQESSRPLGLEPDGNHAACSQADNRHEYSPDAPLSLNDESQKEEDEKDATGKKEAGKSVRNDPSEVKQSVIFVSLFLSVVLADVWESGKRCSPSNHGITKDHEQSTNDAQVAQEEVKVENKAITEPLNDDNTEKSTDSKFRVFLRDDGTRASKHGLNGSFKSSPLTGGETTHNDVDEQEHV